MTVTDTRALDYAAAGEDVDETWIDTSSAGVQIGVSGATVRNMIRDGRLRGYRIGRQFRVSQADVTAFKRAALVA